MNKNIQTRRSFLNTAATLAAGTAAMNYLSQSVSAKLMKNDMTSVADKNAEVQPVNLRCEYLVNPLGIDAVKPRLSWVVESPENGQSPYRFYNGVLKPVERDENGDLVYEWDESRAG